MAIPDSIQRELILPVPRARVWAALTEPRGLSAWFGSTAAVDLRLGGTVTFFWEGEQFTNTGVIEVVEPLRRFAFRWHVHDGKDSVSPPDGPTTRVEFILDDHPEGTRLLLVESGFASLPWKYRGARDRNTRGWEQELSELEGYLAEEGAEG